MTATALERPVAYRANMGTLNAGQISVGNMTLSADDETLTFGSASDPTTGEGIFLGKDGTDYEFRVGDPSARYIHFDGTNWDVNVEDFTAPNPVFTGEVDVQAGEGETRAKITASNGGGMVQLLDENGVVALSIIGRDTFTEFQGSGSRTVNILSQAELHLEGVDGVFAGNQTLSGRVFTLHKDLSSRSHTGDTNQTTLQTVTIPADALGTEGGLRVVLRFSFNGFNSGKTLRVKFGGTTIYTFAPGNVVGIFEARLRIFNDNSASSQVVSGATLDDGGNVDLAARQTASVDTTADQDLTVTAQLANGSDTIGLEESFVEGLSPPM